MSIWKRRFSIPAGRMPDWVMIILIALIVAVAAVLLQQSVT